MQLLNIALVYLGLAHGSDGELVPAEAQEIAIRLREQLPYYDPALIDHVMREAMLSYSDGRDTAVQEAAAALKSLPEDEKMSILNDLASIARADETVKEEETGFINQIADLWGLEYDGSHFVVSS